MRIVAIDPDPITRPVLLGRVEEALRQVGLRRVELVDGDLSLISSPPEGEAPGCVFLGPGVYDNAEQIIQMCRASFPSAILALVLDNDVYAEQALELRRILPVRIIALADIAAMAGFILDCDSQLAAAPGAKNRGVISIAQLKGGVGASTVAAGLAACWARHDLSVALVDFDDLNPQLTDWGRVGTKQRKVVAELLRQGDVPRGRINELVHLVEGFDGKLVVVPQPLLYQESFHFKADVIEGAPSAAIFVESLLTVLREEFDVIVIDTGRSWGIATFAALPLSQQVLLITDDDGMSVRRTLDNLERLFGESGDAQEFDLTKWSIVLNGYTSRLLSPRELGNEIQEMEIFPESAVLYTVPFSDKGRQWGGPGQSFYELAEPSVKDSVKKIAYTLVPFRQETTAPIYDKLLKRLPRFKTNT